MNKKAKSFSPLLLILELLMKNGLSDVYSINLRFCHNNQHSTFMNKCYAMNDLYL